MTSIIINIEGTNGDYQGWLKFNENLITFMCETKKEMLDQAKERVEDYLKNEGQYLKLDIKDVKFFFKFV